MTHTTGLDLGSAASRHRAVIGGGGAERQERDAGRSLGADFLGSLLRGTLGLLGTANPRQ